MITIKHKTRIYDLNATGLARLFGTTKADMVQYCGRGIASMDLRYKILRGEEKKRLISDVAKRIQAGDLAAASKERRPAWEGGWKESLHDFMRTGYKIAALVPKYFKKNVPARLQGNFVKPVNGNFVLDVSNLFRTWLFRKYFQDADAIYEFGCGSAWHLALLARLYPDKMIFGFDWARSSRDIIGLMAKRYGWLVQGGYFDFFHPDKDLALLPNSAVLTFGALEQLGKNFKPYVKFVLNARPKLCVDVAGINEFYDPEDLSDALALRYHRRRKYLYGYLTYLRGLEKEGCIEIIACHHQRFGNMFDDPHSYVIWRPLGFRGGNA